MLERSAGGAIDAQLKVYGTQNVRVVDGSIFPYQPSAHPMGLTYAVAVHAAKILQTLRSGQAGSTYTEMPAISNSSSNTTARFPNVAPTATYDARGSAVLVSGTATSSPAVSTGGVDTSVGLAKTWWMGVGLAALGLVW